MSQSPNILHIDLLPLSRTPFFALAVVTTFTLSVFASAYAQPTGTDKRRTPPPNALAACKGMVNGQACSFKGRRGTVPGSCFTPNDDRPLACRPKDEPQRVADDGPKP